MYDVTADIRSREISRASSLVSVHPGVRVEMVARQREMGKDGGVVLDGRDIGTAVFPDADVKFFLDANPGERAQAAPRRAARGRERRHLRRRRGRRSASGTTRQPPRGVAARSGLGRDRLDSTRLGPEEVVERMLAAVRAREGKARGPRRLARPTVARPARTSRRCAMGLERGPLPGDPGSGGGAAPHGEEEVYLVLEGRGRFRMGDETSRWSRPAPSPCPPASSTASTAITEDLAAASPSSPPRGHGRKSLE